MAIIKLTRSGKAILVIDDSGKVFVTSVISIQNIINKAIPFVLLSKMPFDVPANRFKQSPVYTPPGYIPPEEGRSAMDAKHLKDSDEKKAYIQDVDI